MSKFKELYNADIARYGGKAEAYMRVFHYLYRKAATATFAPARFCYKALFRIWANRRGLELTANQQVGGGCPKTYWDIKQIALVNFYLFYYSCLTLYIIETQLFCLYL